MKYFTFLTFLISFSFSYCPQPQIEKKEFPVEPTSLSILFVGDSNSAGRGWSWNYLLEKDNPEWNVTHITEGGKRTDWMIENLEIQLSQKKFDYVFIYGGNNDVMTPSPLSKPLNNMKKMVDMVHKQGGKVIIVCGFDAKTTFNPEKQRGKNRLCDVQCYCEFKEKRIKYQQALQDSIDCDLVIPPLKGDLSWTPDGIHAAASKHIFMKAYVSDYIFNLEQFKKTKKQFITSQFSLYEYGKINIYSDKMINAIQSSLIMMGYTLKSGCTGEWNKETLECFERFYQNEKLTDKEKLKKIEMTIQNCL